MRARSCHVGVTPSEASMRKVNTGTVYVTQDVSFNARQLRKAFLIGSTLLVAAALLAAAPSKAAIEQAPLSAAGTNQTSPPRMHTLGLKATRLTQVRIALELEDYEAVGLPLRMLSQQGEREAQFLLGIVYSNGLGVQADMTEAVHWYRLAASQGHIEAQYNLGVAYSQGTGVVADALAAAGWYRKAALQGSTDAQFNLGLLYAQGDGVSKDMSQAAKWWHQAAVHGDAAAQYALGLMYVRGDGVDQNITEAVKWWYLAAAQGFERAQQALYKLRLIVVPQ
ncbi:MAG: tetratricopeptide repeat protein [Acidiferrobacterales bacterium]